MPTLELELPRRLVADQALRQGAYLLRIFDGAGAGAGDFAHDATGVTRDVRTLLTASTVGTLKSAQGVAEAWSSGAPLSGVQHMSMLLYHPIELLRFASRLAGRIGGASPVMPLEAGRTVASALWLLWIAATALLSARRLREVREPEARESEVRRTLQYRLAKLALDTPLALHFLCGATALPLVVVGLLGFTSSLLGLRAALADPAKGARPRVTLPMPLLALSSSRALSRAWGLPARPPPLRLPGRMRRLSAACGAAPSPCSPGGASRWARRRINSGPLSRSTEW